MNKKGFTLIELLTVITIMAILSIIAIPNVLNIINNNKKDIMLSDAAKLVSLAKYQIALGESTIKTRCATTCDLTLDELNVNNDIGTDPDGGDYLGTSYVRYTVANSIPSYCIFLTGSKRQIGSFNNCVSEDDLLNRTKVVTLVYKQVEYIESSGTQYIDTGYASSNTVGIRAISSSTSGSDSIVMGSRGTSSDSRLAINYATGALALSFNNFYNTTVSTSSGIMIDSKINYLNNRQRFANNTEYASVEGTLVSTNTFNIGLFAGFWGSTTPSLFYSGKIYLAQVTDGTTLVRNMIPCYRISDNVAGMYDTVNDVFYTNAGTGTFTVGPDAT